MKKLICLLSFICIVFSPSLFADTLKMGVVNLNQVLQKSSSMKQLNTDLDKKFKPRQEEVNKATADFQTEASQLDAATTLSPEDRTKLQNKILTDKANVQILTASFQRDLAIEKDKLLQSFMAKLSTVINQIAKDDQYDIIQQQTSMLYINPKLDITQQVLNQI